MKGRVSERLFWISGWAYDFSKIATIILLLGLLTHYFFFSVLIVRGRSMEPNYHDGDVLLINKISYYLNNPSRGDVIAMFFPGETEKRFIKRLVGLPGEAIAVTDGRLELAGRPMAESYLADGTLTTPDSARTLGAGDYFVLGDNRSVSSDSRAWGPVPEAFLIGKITGRLGHLPTKADRTNAN